MLLALCLLWLLPGLVWRMPWKPVETVTVQVVEESYVRDWKGRATVLGEPFAGPPVYLQVAGMARRAFSGPLPRHEAMRLPNILWIALALAAVMSVAAHGCSSRDAWRAALLLVGCLGLLLPARLVNPDLALLPLAGWCAWAAARMRERALAGGAVLGLAGGAGLAVCGAAAPVMALLCALTPPIFWRAFRTRGWLAGSLVAAIVAGASGAAAYSWAADGGWSADLLPASFASLPAGFGELLRVGSWAVWPALPLALLVIYAMRGRMNAHPETAACSAALAAAALTFVFATKHAESSVFLLMPPAAALAARGAGRITGEIAKVFDYFAFFVVGVGMIGLFWLVWLAAVFGWPPFMLSWLGGFGIGQMRDISLLAVFFSLLATSAYVVFMLKLGSSPDRMTVNWAVGLVVAWTVFCLLWLPDVDRAKQYSILAAKMNAAMPAEVDGCIARPAVPPADSIVQLAYFTGRQFPRLDSTAGSRCEWLVDVPDRGGRGWAEVVRAGRGSRTAELALYRRV